MNPKGAPRSEQPDMNGSAPNVHRWSASYPAGVAQTVNTAALVSLKELVEEAFRSEGAKVALIQMGRRFTFAELDRYSLQFAAWLQSEGVRKGDRVAIMLPNVLQYGVVLCAAFRVGAVVVNINPLFTAREVQLQLEDSGATVLVALANVLEAVAPVLARTAVRRVCVTEVGDLLGGFKRLVVNRVARRGAGKRFAVIPCAIAWAEAVRRGSAETYVEVPVAGADLSFLQYTGGTTAAPKAAALTHANLCANILQSQAWVKGALRPSGLAVTALPLYHIFALEGNFLLFLRLGWSNLLIVNARDVRGFVKELGKYRPGFISGVNTLFRALLSTPGFTELDFSDLQIALTGGMDTSRTIAEEWSKVTGVALTQGWGLTECSPGVCINPPDADFNGSVGVPMPSTQVLVIGEDGAEVAAGQIGELCVKGPQVMSGYWKQAELTAQAFTADGWLRTGDLGRMDERGFVFIVDRLSDVINVSGFKVYPNEVEAVATERPDVAQAAAVAEIDERGDEKVALYVVPAAKEVDVAALLKHCRESLAPYKVPRQVHVRTELPMSNVGKVLRKFLRPAPTVPPALG